MKILEVTNLLAPEHGGSAEVPYQISRSLAKKGHQVTIYTSDFKSGQSNRASFPGVTVHALRTWTSLANLQITPGIINRVKDEINLFDVIHMHNYRTFQNITVYRYARKYSIPYVLQAHGSLTTFFQKGLLKKLFDNLWGRRILRDAAKVIAVNRAEVEQYHQMSVSEEKIEVIPHGVNLDEFASLPQKGEFRKKYGLGDSRIIIYLGRIDKIKGLELLVRAFANLAKTADNVILVIAGPDYGYLTFLKKLVASLSISDNVLFTGPLYEREKLQAYVDADIYVLPSSYEIFGITILEALACGTPVVVTDRCGIADIINGQAGMVVPYDQDKLQDACLNMLNNDQMRLEFAAKGEALVRQNFNWEKITEQLERVYQEVQHK